MLIGFCKLYNESPVSLQDAVFLCQSRDYQSTRDPALCTFCLVSPHVSSLIQINLFVKLWYSGVRLDGDF
jgi:hypothetical protein